MPQWFLYLQGFAMLIMGLALIRLRPHPSGASFYTRYVNLGTMWALICCAVGVALLAMALGYWRWPPTSLGTTTPRSGATSVKRPTR